jgi:hypothetical protein
MRREGRAQGHCNSPRRGFAPPWPPLPARALSRLQALARAPLARDDTSSHCKRWVKCDTSARGAEPAAGARRARHRRQGLLRTCRPPLRCMQAPHAATSSTPVEGGQAQRQGLRTSPTKVPTVGSARPGGLYTTHSRPTGWAAGETGRRVYKCAMRMKGGARRDDASGSAGLAAPPVELPSAMALIG